MLECWAQGHSLKCGLNTIHQYVLFLFYYPHNHQPRFTINLLFRSVQKCHSIGHLCQLPKSDLLKCLAKQVIIPMAHNKLWSTWQYCCYNRCDCRCCQTLKLPSISIRKHCFQLLAALYCSNWSFPRWSSALGWFLFCLTKKFTLNSSLVVWAGQGTVCFISVKGKKKRKVLALTFSRNHLDIQWGW